MHRSISVSIVISVCLWLAMRDFLVVPAIEADGYDWSLYSSGTDVALDAISGDSDRAHRQIQPAVTIELTEFFPGLKPLVEASTSAAASFSSSSGAWLMVVVVWAVLAVVNMTVGWGPTVEASASLRRLARVAAVLGVLQVLPLSAWAMLTAFGSTTFADGCLAAGATLFSLVATVPVLLPPVRLRGTKQKLPRVDDPVFLARVAELARKMNLPIPLVRLQPSMTGSQQTQAYAGCLPAPQLVVTDGILHRLSPAERDAVVAHELGHVANGSLWLLTAIIPATCAVTVAVTAWIPLAVVVPFGLALTIGLRRSVCRPLELDADRRAARVAGFRNTATALAKIHAVNSPGAGGLMQMLIYATATHPSRAVRLWSLRKSAPTGDLPDIVLDEKTIRRHRIVARTAFLSWLFILAVTLTGGCLAFATPLLAVPLWITVVTPTSLQYFGQWRQISIARRQVGSSSLRTAVLVVVLLGFPILLGFPGAVAAGLAPLAWLQDSPLFFLLFPLALVGVSIAASTRMQRAQATHKLRGEMTIAMQVDNWQRVLDIGRSAPAIVARDPWLRYHIAFARAICADRTEAIAEFEELWKDDPGFPISAITLSALLLDSDQPERALAAARGAAERLPSDPATYVLVARTQRRLGQYEGAREASRRALALDPNEGAAHAAAALSLDVGEFSQAQQSIATALELAPGAPYVLLVRAEIAIRTQAGDPRTAFDEAVAVIRSNPMAFYRADVARLEQALAKRGEPAPQARSAVP